MSRRVLITGGNRGIGLATARSFLDGGDRVVVTYRKEPPPPDLLAVPCDVRDQESVDNCFTAAEELLGGPVDTLISNAGVVADSLLLQMSEERFLDGRCCVERSSAVVSCGRVIRHS